jgi:glycosyltransferase involved in cell wall biosynthesis
MTKDLRALNVALLLATRDGSRHIEAQLRSLKHNSTPFTLHWIDDQSTDNTRSVVRELTPSLEIPLQEWHHAHRQGVPGAFFHLLECVEADIYLFCDQDDIWQTGKIDATVNDLRSDLDAPTLCFSDPLVFHEDQPERLCRLSQVLGIQPSKILQGSRSLLASMVWGQASGFTRPLREMFIQHKDIAREYAHMHDWWMYLVANACGTSRLLRNVPTTLYRQHGSNFSAFLLRRPRGPKSLIFHWELQRTWRRLIAHQARGFLLAARTLPHGPRLLTMRATAELVAELDRRQTPTAIIQLAKTGGVPPSWSHMFWLTASCLYCSAEDR